MVAMPEKLVGLQQRETTAQGTTAWGEPASVILKCGVTVQEPVSDPCAEVNGIDWVLRPKDAPENSAPPVSASSSAAAGPENRATGTWTATTYGRTPAIEVTFDADKVSSSTLLAQLGGQTNSVSEEMHEHQRYSQRCQNRKIEDSIPLDPYLQFTSRKRKF